MDEDLRSEILRLYYQDGLLGRVIARRLGITKSTVLYWVHKSDSPISEQTAKLAGSRRIVVAAGKVDLLPFVNPSHLRWVDNSIILLRSRNSRVAVLRRRTNARDFFRLVGFYLAEGNKTAHRADLQNTNAQLISAYLRIVVSFVRTEIRIRNIVVASPRADKQLLVIGGICLKELLMNAIDCILSFLEVGATPDAEETGLGLSFLRGNSDGDGTVSRAKQRRSNKARIQLRITEGKRTYALRLVKVVKRILGVGYLYKPKNRNYYDIVVGISPQRAAFLLTSGFFSSHPEARRRIAMKVMDSPYFSRYVSLYQRFGESPFCVADLSNIAPAIRPDFIGRSVSEGRIHPVGIVTPKGRGRIRWFRSYILSREIQIVARLTLQNIEVGGPSDETIGSQELRRLGSSNNGLQEMPKTESLCERGTTEETCAVRSLGLLGETGSRIWGPKRQVANNRPGPRYHRGAPHRAHFYRGCVEQIPCLFPLLRGVRQSATI